MLIRATDSIWNPAQKLRLSLVRLAIPAFLTHPALGSPDDFCEDLRFIPLDEMCD
jgi:hypothetical protein